jgi:hypothetical protein
MPARVTVVRNGSQTYVVGGNIYRQRIMPGSIQVVVAEHDFVFRKGEYCK